MRKLIDGGSMPDWKRLIIYTLVFFDVFFCLVAACFFTGVLSEKSRIAKVIRNGIGLAPSFCYIRND